MSQYENYSDEKLAEHRQEIQVEEDRRNKLRMIPLNIENLAREYLDNGGDKKDLTAAIKRGEKSEDELAGIEPVEETPVLEEDVPTE